MKNHAKSALIHPQGNSLRKVAAGRIEQHKSDPFTHLNKIKLFETLELLPQRDFEVVSTI